MLFDLLIEQFLSVEHLQLVLFGGKLVHLFFFHLFAEKVLGAEHFVDVVLLDASGVFHFVNYFQVGRLISGQFFEIDIFLVEFGAALFLVREFGFEFFDGLFVARHFGLELGALRHLVTEALLEQFSFLFF